MESKSRKNTCAQKQGGRGGREEGVGEGGGGQELGKGVRREGGWLKQGEDGQDKIFQGQ